MPIPSTIADISTTAASNSPAGTDAIGTSLDDYLRTIQAILKVQFSTGTTLASASTITPLADGNYIQVTGTTSITAIGSTNSWNGRVIVLRFAGALTLTHNATSLILPGGANITTVAGDVLGFVQESSGNWRCIFYQPSGGYQAYDADLAAIAALSPAQGEILYYNGSAWTKLAVGTSGQFLKTQGAAANPIWDSPSSAGITVATVQATTSGTAFDFTGIPSTVKRIKVLLNRCSLSGTDQMLVQIGDSGGFETSGYISESGNTAASSTSTSGFVLRAGDAANGFIGTLVLDLFDASTNTWIASGGQAKDNGTTVIYLNTGVKSLSATLDRVRLTRSGTDTFDSGSVTITYE